jgi:hypothetical protein
MKITYNITCLSDLVGQLKSMDADELGAFIKSHSKNECAKMFGFLICTNDQLKDALENLEDGYCLLGSYTADEFIAIQREYQSDVGGYVPCTLECANCDFWEEQSVDDPRCNFDSFAHLGDWNFQCGHCSSKAVKTLIGENDLLTVL